MRWNDISREGFSGRNVLSLAFERRARRPVIIPKFKLWSLEELKSAVSLRTIFRAEKNPIYNGLFCIECTEDDPEVFFLLPLRPNLKCYEDDSCIFLSSFDVIILSEYGWPNYLALKSKSGKHLPQP